MTSSIISGFFLYFEEVKEKKRKPQFRRNSLAPKIDGIEDSEELSEGLESVTLVNGILSSDEEDEACLTDDDDEDEKEVKMSMDELISGALESAFWAMDKLIMKDKDVGFRIRYVQTVASPHGGLLGISPSNIWDFYS